MDNLKEKWDIFALHTWLTMSSFGIMFAVLSFIQDIGGFYEIKYSFRGIKGILSFFFGFIFYYFIGIPHIHGARKLI